MKKILMILVLPWFLCAQTFPGAVSDTLYFDDFENGSAGWTSENLADPQQPSFWHLTGEETFSPITSFVISDSSTGLYPEGIFSALVSPEIDLPPADKINLEFRFIADLGFNGTLDSDKWYVELTTNSGADWSLISNSSQVRSGNNWFKYPNYFSNEDAGELTQFGGETIRFRIVMQDTADGLTGRGLFIDDPVVIAYFCQPDQYEPNDSPDDAFALAFGDTVFNASICPDTDPDYFLFDAVENDFVRLVDLESTFPRPQIYILDNSLTPVFSNIYTNDLRFFIPETGTYFVWVLKGINQEFSSVYSFALDTLSVNPDILSVNDIPEDQGLQVRVTWKPSYYDPPDGINPTDFYALWRLAYDSLAAGRAASPITFESFADFDYDLIGKPGNRVFKISGTLWDFIAQIPAVSNRPFDNYSYVAPTIYDNQPATFVVSAVGKQGHNIPTLWGMPGSGISLDNISPQFANFSITPHSEGIRLDWTIDRIVHHDLAGIKIYRHNQQGFSPSVESLLGVLPPGSNRHDDLTVEPGQDYYYIIEAFDDGGNSAFTPELTVSLTSAEDEFTKPDKFELYQNYPNPFNPTTKIQFTIPSVETGKLVPPWRDAPSLRCKLAVYDPLGRKVATLIDEERSPGVYEIEFNGTGLSSGVYFYRLQAGAYVQTKKFILAK
jgi:hypothetical protein